MKLNIKRNDSRGKCNIEAPRVTITKCNVSSPLDFHLSLVLQVLSTGLSTINKGVGTMAQGGWAARGPRASGSSLLP